MSEAERFAQAKGMTFRTTSARLNNGVARLFEDIVNALVAAPVAGSLACPGDDASSCTDCPSTEKCAASPRRRCFCINPFALFHSREA